MVSNRPHDVPTVGELVESVREWLDRVVTGDATPNPELSSAEEAKAKADVAGAKK